MTPEQPPNALDELKSAEQSVLMDAIDRLRGQGFNKELNLPQVIVCGDQSSGKSSVLEAISQVPFPAGTSTTTRFASELVLRNSSTVTMRASLQAAVTIGVSPEDKEILAQFNPEFRGPEDFPAVHDSAVDCLSKLQNKVDFYPHRLRVELSGPSQPHLTLVDLPGLIANAPEGKSQNVSTVREIMEDYMKQSRSIILAVIPATEDPATKQVLASARKFDKDGHRTMGILTKPDLIQTGNLRMFIEVIENRHYKFHLGWHVLRNLNSAEISSLPRDEVERRFFSDPNGGWSTIANDLKGVKTLRPKLREILFVNITKSLPVLIADMQTRIGDCEGTLKKLGPSRSDLKEQRLFLDKVCSDLTTLIENATKGTYDGKFFADSGHAKDTRRLRNALRDQYSEFNSRMTRRGACYKVRDSAPGTDLPHHSNAETRIKLKAGRDMTQVSKEQFLLAIEQYMKSNRGLELEGEYSDRIVESIFKIQCTPWESIADASINECLNTAKQFFRLALEHVAPQWTATAIYKEIAAKTFQVFKQDLDKKLKELLVPFQKLHPFTLDPLYLAEKNRLDLQAGDSLSAAYKLMNCVAAYYTVSQRKFVDNVVALAVENCIVQRLSSIFNSAIVIELEQVDSSTFQRLASEPLETVLKREKTMSDLSTLQDVVNICSQHATLQEYLSTTERWANEDSDHEVEQVSDTVRSMKTKDLGKAKSSKTASGSSILRSHGTSDRSVPAPQNNPFVVPAASAWGVSSANSVFQPGASQSGSASGGSFNKSNGFTGGGLFGASLNPPTASSGDTSNKSNGAAGGGLFSGLHNPPVASDSESFRFGGGGLFGASLDPTTASSGDSSNKSNGVAGGRLLGGPQNPPNAPSTSTPFGSSPRPKSGAPSG